MVVFTCKRKLIKSRLTDGLKVVTWGDSGGGRAKREMMGIGFWRLAGWEIER